MAVQKHTLYSAPGSAAIPGSADISEEFIESIRRNEVRISQRYIATCARSHPGERGNEESLLIGKITELLNKEFGEMPLGVSIIRKDMARYFEIRVRYGIEGNHYICENIGRDRFLEVRDDYGLQMVAKVTAENLIRHIRTDIMDTMFGSEIKEKIPNGTSQEEKAFRKILI